jgi:hypothetical protein
VCSADRTRLLANLDKLFPAARVEIVAAPKDRKRSYANSLLEILGRSALPDVLTTKWISQQMGTPWRNVSKHVLTMPAVRRAIENLGWEYVSGRGRNGSRFDRTGGETEIDMKITTIPPRHHGCNAIGEAVEYMRCSGCIGGTHAR